MCTRSMWQRAGAVRLFAEHVTLSAEDDNATMESVVRLWKVLTTMTLYGIIYFLIDDILRAGLRKQCFKKCLNLFSL